MNKYDEKYEFRLATLEDIDAIMYFYREEWNKHHILANDKDFFCYQHLVDNQVNFMLAINKETKAIEAAEGFIQYSKALKDVAAVMWKVSAKAAMPFLGVEVIKRSKEATQCRTYIGVGANPKTAIPLHIKKLQHYVGKLKHYYKLADLDQYQIAVVQEKRRVDSFYSSRTYKLVKVQDIGELEGKYDFSRDITRKPYKDQWYITRRYFHHPVYQYLTWGIQDDKNRMVALLFAREIQYNSAKILRIIDFLGDETAISGLGNDLEALMKENHYEYIDFYCKGIRGGILNQAGFIERDESDKNIIPNYFEPFVQKNIDIWYVLTDDETFLFKGDADQDRPSHR